MRCKQLPGRAFKKHAPTAVVRAGLLTVWLAGIAAQAAAGPFSAQLDLSDLLPGNGGDGSTGFVLNGVDAGDRSGRSVCKAGDVNGDGLDDFIIGTRFGVESYVVFASDTPQSGNFPAEFELSTLATGDGSAGFVLVHDDFDVTGGGVSEAGDINGDGVDDVIVCNFVGPDLDGVCFVVFGRNTALGVKFSAVILTSSLIAGDGSTGFVLRPAVYGSQLGRSVGKAGDINGDGLDDLIVGAPFFPGFLHPAGAAYVLFGRDTALSGNFPAGFELSSLAAGDGSAGFALRTTASWSAVGASVSAAGDVNGDGVDDVMVGDAGGPPQSIGFSYVVFGRDTANSGNFPAQLEVDSLAAGDGSTGFSIWGSEIDDGTGSWVSPAGDVNDDGIDDIAIGAAQGNPGGRSGAGISYVVFGRDTANSGNFPSTLQLSSMAAGDGSAGFVLNGIDEGDNAGNPVATAGDINGDGVADLIVGANGADPGGESDAGESYVFFGRNTAQSGNFPAEFELSILAAGDGSSGFVMNGIDASDGSGGSASAVGDVNGDGLADLIVGASFADPGGRSDAGESYLVFGRADTDDDGVYDAADNCTEIANANQRDTNDDGFGNVCDADLNNDCDVNFEDVGLMKSVFFSADPDADLDGDGAVNFIDLAVMKAGIFQPPGPSGVANGCEKN